MSSIVKRYLSKPARISDRMAENSYSINIITGHVFGGILSVYETLIPFLNQHFQVNIITLNKSFNYNDKFFPGNEKINLGVKPPLTGIRALKFIIRLFLISKRRNLKHYIVNNSATAILVYITSFLLKLDFFIHIHEPISNNLNNKNQIIKKITIFFLNKTFRKSLGVICNSKSVQNDMRRYFPKIKTKLIYNPIPVSKIMNWTGTNPFLSETNINCIFVSVGRLTKAKDYNTLIEACIELRLREIVDYKVFIVGDGEEHNSLKLFIEKCNLTGNICLVGFKENPIPYVKYCDCYLSTSIWEGFGLTIAYAMLLRRPIIASKTGGAIELLQPNNAFFDIGNVIDLSNRMEHFIKTRKNDLTIIQKNFKKILDFDSNNVAANYINFINEQLLLRDSKR